MTQISKTKTAEDVLGLIGNTPLVRLNRVIEPRMATVLAKVESGNPGGSVNDRICLSMIGNLIWLSMQPVLVCPEPYRNCPVRC